MTKLIILISVLCLTGCSSELAQQQDIGPLPENYQDLIRQHMYAQLKDPYSAVYRFGTPYQGSIWKGLVFGGTDYGWLCPVGINAKNAFGGYAGEQSYTFLIKNGRVIFPTMFYTTNP